MVVDCDSAKVVFCDLEFEVGVLGKGFEDADCLRSHFRTLFGQRDAESERVKRWSRGGKWEREEGGWRGTDDAVSRKSNDLVCARGCHALSSLLWQD